MSEEIQLDPVIFKQLVERSKGTFWEYLGCELHSLQPNKVVISLEVRPHHLNPIGILHGGVSSTMLDNAMGLAAILTRGPHEKMVTSNLNVHFVSPLKGGKIFATAEVIHQSRKSITVTGSVTDEQGQLATYGTGSFRVI